MAHQLTKHHGLGNDFIVALGSAADVAGLTPDHARLWCDRHVGVGADGLLLGALDEADADVVMTLFNADGSRAEMSGNGIRCLAHAVVRRRTQSGGELVVRTDDGPRTVAVTPTDVAHTVSATVDMGPARIGPDPDRETDGPTGDSERTHDPRTREARVALGTDALERAAVDLGNPHLVLLVADLDAIDIAAAGRHHEAAYSSGMNVHAVAPTPGETDSLTMRISERGAGVTRACGTGATAAARAAHDWGLVGDRVTVHMDGGDVEVLVGERMTLIGPATYVAALEMPA